MSESAGQAALFVRWAAAMHVAALLVAALAAAAVLTDSGSVFYASMASFVLVIAAAGWGRRRWLRPYEVTSDKRLVAAFEGDLPSWRGFERALLHAGEVLERDGRVWVRASRLFTCTLFAAWVVLAVADAALGA